MTSENLTLAANKTVLQSRILEILKGKEDYKELENVTLRFPEELKGEHFATESAYVQLHFKGSKVKNTFLKIYASNVVHREMMKTMQVMDKETSFYNEFLPVAKEFASERGCENMLDIFPHCIYADEEMVLLENLVLDDGFIMLPKSELQDIHSAKMVLSNLAKLHAVSHGMIQDVGLKQFKEKWSLNISEITTKSNFMESIVVNGPRLCLGILKGNMNNSDSQEAIQFLLEYIKTVSGRLQKLLEKAAKSEFVTLGHGDCWNNNMLFKMDSKSGKALKNVLVDLQATRLASPVIDISYFLFSSVKPNLRREFLNQLLEHYHDEFKRNVELLDISCPITFKEFVDEYKKHLDYGFLMDLVFLPAIGALKSIEYDDMGSGEVEEGFQAFNDGIAKWIENNPEAAEHIAKEIILVVKEYKDIMG